MIRYSDLVKMNACSGGLERFVEGRYFSARIFDRPVSINDIAFNSRCNVNDMMWLIRATMLDMDNDHAVRVIISTFPGLRKELEKCAERGVNLVGLEYNMRHVEETMKFRWALDVPTTLMYHSRRDNNMHVNNLCRKYLINFFNAYKETK